ncbi:HTH domain-containing protein [Bacillus sp. FJAT-29937]|uniref:HTH domain-containing protein n=1 Tax=Bacillus sp. FJAT-29937 TaxID=1720553 RepID=UPI00082CDE7C|nr:HTH domain-containing protein [Bacillus sp. FJAT-29937]
MDIKSGDPRDYLKIVLEDYKITPYTFGLISGLDEETVLEFSNHKTDFAHLPHEKKGYIMSMIAPTITTEFTTSSQRIYQ